MVYSLRTMVKIKMTTDWDQRKDNSGCDYGIRTSVRTMDGVNVTIEVWEDNECVRTRGQRQRGHELRCNSL